jgi:hypothetical protein
VEPGESIAARAFLMAKFLAGTPLTAPLLALSRKYFLPSTWSMSHRTWRRQAAMLDDGESQKFRPKYTILGRHAVVENPCLAAHFPLPSPVSSKLSDLFLFPALLYYLNGWTTAFAIDFSDTVSLHCRYNLALTLGTLHILRLPGQTLATNCRHSSSVDPV